MRVSLSQINTKTNDFAANANQISEQIGAMGEGTLCVFPELALSGSPLYSLTTYGDLFSKSEKYCQELAKSGRDFIFGLPVKREGKAYNALAFASNGEIKALSAKRNLSSFDTGFAVGEGFSFVSYGGKSVAFGFWDDLEDFVSQNKKADIVICSANIVFELDKQERVLEKAKQLSQKLGCSLIVVNRVGAECRYIFNGGSFVFDKEGNLCAQMPLFSAESLVCDSERLIPIAKTPFEENERLYEASVLGIRDYYHKNGIKKAVIGLSGGIDSALVVVLAVEALGKENVIGVLLPSEYSTSHSVTDAVESAERLGIEYYTIPIKESFTSVMKALNPVFANLPFSLAEENLQSRIRLCILMGIANKLGAALLNTSNKSEAAVGYGTLYGDTSGGIGAIGDMYKTQVWELSRWINRQKEIIPENSITKAPSAELRPDQKDSDSLPDYAVLDGVLFQHLELGKSREEIISQGYEPETVDKILRLVRITEWKRRQVAPSLKMSRCTFGIDRLMPLS